MLPRIPKTGSQNLEREINPKEQRVRLYFTDEKNEAQRVSCPKSTSYWSGHQAGPPVITPLPLKKQKEGSAPRAVKDDEGVGITLHLRESGNEQV